MPNAKATFEPPLLVVAVTVASEPAESVVAEAENVGVMPLVPVAPAAPVWPAGRPKFSVRFAPLLELELVTVALEPGARVETWPTVIVVDGGPCGPCGPAGPAGPRPEPTANENAVLLGTVTRTAVPPDTLTPAAVDETATLIMERKP
jgi:hypothetical protein